MGTVHDVECPICKRRWTGEFDEPLPDKAVCKDCVRRDWNLGGQHQHTERTDLPEFTKGKRTKTQVQGGGPSES